MPFKLLNRLTHTQAVFLMVAVTLMWSIAGVVSRQLESAARFEVTFWRSAFTFVSLLLILPLWRAADRASGALRGVPTSQGALQRHWGILAGSRAFWVSGVCWSVMFTAFMLALTFTSVANVLVIMAAGPLFTAVIARVFIGQRLPGRTWAAIVTAGAGIVYMYGSQMWAAFTDPAANASGLVLGSLASLCVPVGGAINWTVVQRSQQHGESIDLVPSVLVGALISSVLTLPLAFPFLATGSDIAWLALLGLVQLAIPCALAVVCARSLKAPEVSLLALLEVIFGIVWAWLWANETPGSEVLLGGSVVIAALLLNELAGWRDRQGALRIQTLSARNTETSVGETP
ncbi:DMT family transporter [Hydrogenophaga pseudoflava]|uniref:EamA-like transporter family protein n=1 Tax=Hydrogenophaga pseudoflava TaxID=47421 RepID=A0A4P6WZU5_HYDPS|nr:DMT family transporter [Hydrogenophaga pseudoflava]QBM28249.1 EamA-like transporter family protein [Hydrogenophaga pseudoflava]